MKLAPLILLSSASLLAGNIERMLDRSLSPAQRNDACRELIGQNSASVVGAMREGLNDPKLRACAGQSLRRSESFDVLKDALRDENPETRAAAARELAATRKAEFIPLIAPLARDGNLVTAANAVQALSLYDGAAVSPTLVDLAKDGGMTGTIALNRLAQMHDPQSIQIARKLMSSSNLGDVLTGIRIAGEMGDESDVPNLSRIAAKDTQEMTASSRGFGLMPAISLARAAATALSNIDSRKK